MNGNTRNLKVNRVTCIYFPVEQADTIMTNFDIPLTDIV